MKPTKIVYVKDYKRNLSNVVSEPEEGYVEYPIHKISMKVMSFHEELIHIWHPLAKVTRVKMEGVIFFRIDNLEFEVRDSKDDADASVVISTDFQTKNFNRYTHINNLNLFKEFEHSFMLQDFVDSINGYENIDPNGVRFVISNVHYSNHRYNQKQLHIEIDSDEFEIFHINYLEVKDGYEYYGIGYPGVEMWYDYDTNIDLEKEIEREKRKLELVKFVTHKLYDIFGVGKRNNLTLDT